MVQPRYSSRLNPVLVCALFVIIGLQSTHLASGDDCEASWSTDGVPLEVNNTVNTLAVMPGEDGPRLVLGGIFTEADGIETERILIRDGETWSTLGDGFNQRVNALAVCVDDDGPTLYAGGFFTASGDQPLQYVARWDGEAWQPLGEGVNDEVRALACKETDDGHVLYVGGHFNEAGNDTALLIAQWDGENWHTLGEADGLWGGSVHAIIIEQVDDDQAPQVYAGGSLSLPGGGNHNIVRWDGSEWHALVGASTNGTVRALTFWEQNGSSTLVAAGSFTSIGGVPANFIAQWDGEGWSAMSSGFSSTARTVTVHDDGTGATVYAGGNFTADGDGDWLNLIAVWNGEAWDPLHFGAFGGPVRAIRSINDAFGPGLVVGGAFDTLIPAHAARWQRNGLPKFIEHPQSVDAVTGETVNFGAVLDDQGDLDYQWLRNGELLEDDDRISGATSPELMIDDCTPDDEGVYVLEATNMCGTALSWSAVLTVEDVGAPADLNGDGVVDVLDLLILLGSWGECPNPDECPADLNNDGAVGVLDLMILLGEWGPVV